MKWGHVLSNNLGLLPAALQQASINYKKWKKYTKNSSCNDIVKELETDCKKTDETFKKSYDNLYKTSCLCRSFSKEDLRLFVDLNKTSIYKICKRIDKKLIPSPHAKTWLQICMSLHTYQFMGGWRVTALSIKLPVECPICLDNTGRIAISRCGHFMCIECLFRFYEIGKHKGTLLNVISHYDNAKLSKCPICRITRPYSKIHILPEARNLCFIEKTI